MLVGSKREVNVWRSNCRLFIYFGAHSCQKTPLSIFCVCKKSISSHVLTTQSPKSTNGAKKIKFKVYAQKSTNKILLPHSPEDCYRLYLKLLSHYFCSDHIFPFAEETSN